MPSEPSNFVRRSSGSACPDELDAAPTACSTSGDTLPAALRINSPVGRAPCGPSSASVRAARPGAAVSSRSAAGPEVVRAWD
ncbi:MAG: hypothetical protein ABJE66_22710 [Deltaproteobacteria bacterium]